MPKGIFDREITRGFYRHMDGSVVCKRCELTLKEGCKCYGERSFPIKSYLEAIGTRVNQD